MNPTSKLLSALATASLVGSIATGIVFTLGAEELGLGSTGWLYGLGILFGGLTSYALFRAASEGLEYLRVLAGEDAAPVERPRCSNCGASVEPDATSCPQCGEGFDE